MGRRDRKTLDALERAKPAADELGDAALKARLRSELLGRELELPQVGRFVISRFVGRGGMGAVYAAYDPKLDRAVAVKVVEAVDERGRARVLREARALARLSHPNVVGVYDAEVGGERVAIAMELVDGETLAAWLDEPHDWRQIVGTFIEAGLGLAAVHDADMVHGDFKPTNVLVGRDGRPRVADFGLAGIVADREASSDSGSEPIDTHTRTRLGGTPAYMAPEQKAGAIATPASDQYSFAVALVEGLTGQRPSDAGLPPDARRLPRWLRAALVRALSPAPELRFASMHELLAALHAGLQRRRRTWLLVGGVALSAALLGLGVSEWTREDGVLCELSAEGFDHAWNAETAERLRAHFSATGRPYADELAGRVIAILDDYRDRWSLARQAACVDTHVRGIQSQRRLDERGACLDHHSLWAGALVDEWLATDDVAVLDRSIESLAALPSLADCSDPERLDSQTWLPQDPARRARVLALRAEATEINARCGVHRDQICIDEAKALLARTRPEDGRHWRAELALSIADAEFGLQPQGADGAIRSALVVASDTREPRLIAKATLELFSWTLGIKNDIAAAEAMLPVIEAVARSSGDPMTISRFLVDQGKLQVTRGQFEASLHSYAQAIESYRDHIGEPGDGHTRSSAALALALERQGEVQIRTGDFAAADASLKEAHDIQLRLVGAGHPDEVGARFELAQLLMMQAKRAEALALFSEILVDLRAIYGKEHIRVTAALSNRGILLGALGRYDEARADLEQSLRIRDDAGLGDHVQTTQVLQGLATVELALGRPKAAEDHLVRALGILERKLGRNHPELYGSLNALGNVKGKQGKVGEAAKLYARAVAVIEAAHGPLHPQLAAPLTNLGQKAIEQGRFGEAIGHCERALRIDRQHLGADHPDLAYGLTCLGDAHLGAGHRRRAAELLERAVELRDGDRVDAGELGHSLFSLARAIVPADSKRAAAVAARAEAMLLEAGPGERPRLEALRRWRQRHLLAK